MSGLTHVDWNNPYFDPGERVMVPRAFRPGTVSIAWIARQGIRGTVLGPNGVDNRNYVRVRWDDGRIDDAVPIWGMRRLDLVERLGELAATEPESGVGGP